MNFETGQTYSHGYIGDSDIEVLYTITKRTPKFITLEDSLGNTKRVGTYKFEGIEKAKPEGTYSLCPVISADRPIIK